MQIPVDAESIKDITELEHMNWPVCSAECKKLTDEMINLVLAFSRFNDSAMFADIYQLKVRNILFNILFLSYSLITVDRIRKSGHDFVASERCILLNALRDERFPTQSIFVPNKHSPSLKSIIKGLVDQVNLFRCTTFSFGSGPLSNQYIIENNLSSKILYWTPSQYVPERTTKSRDSLHLKEFGSDLSAHVRQIWKKHEIAVSRGAYNYLRMAITSELFMAEDHVQRSFGLGKKGTKVVLVGTGGHYPHRLLSYYFIRDGNKVIRFDHGGERALFLDSHWGVNEFAFLNTFVTFGEGLKKRLDKNIREKKIPVALDEKQGFEVKGMVLESFRNIFQLKRETQGDRVRKVMLLMPGLLGNWIIPGNYPPDLVYLNAIWQTINVLKNNGFYVILKKHPKTVRSKSFCLFDQFVDEINEDYFSKVMDIADAYVFFYCGTAFCEALMSRKPIVYINLPYRRTDSQTRLELEKSLCWIDCDDTDGLFIDHGKIIAYLRGNDQDIMSRRTFVEKNYLTSSH